MRHSAMIARLEGGDAPATKASVIQDEELPSNRERPQLVCPSHPAHPL